MCQHRVMTIDRPRWVALREAFKRYSQGRAELLEAIGVRGSNRDPLAEFSERLVAALLDGEMASNRVQRGWDVLAGGRHVQVRYLANPADGWINEHHVQMTDDLDDYAIVFFEALLPISVVVLSKERLVEINSMLGKRHPRQDVTLQLTRVNYRQLLAERDRFSTVGVRVFDVAEAVNPASG